MLNWISRMETVLKKIEQLEIERFLTIKMCIHAKLYCVKYNYLHKNGFGVK